MTPAVRELLQRDTFSPYRLANIAARYDLSQLNSLVYDGSNRVQLVGDLSGNSAVNCFVSTASGGAFTTPGVNMTGGSVLMTVDLAMVDWTPASDTRIFDHLFFSAGLNFSVVTTGTLRVTIGDGANASYTSTASTGLTDGTRHTIAMLYSPGVDVKFYVDGAQLGTAVAASKVMTYQAGTVSIGASGTDSQIYSLTITNNSSTTFFSFLPGGAAKLATSFVSGGATYSISTSGRFGSRICGARDRVNMTVAEQPVLTIASGGNYLTYDGSNDCLASAPFPYAQPESVYFVGSIITQGGNRVFYDGLASAEVMECFSLVTSTLISITGGPSVVSTSVLATSVRAVIRSLFQGTTSSVGLNLISAVSGTIGSTSAANGIIVGARSSIAAFGNITESELILRSAADSAPLQARIAAYMIRKWRVTLP